MLFAAFLPRRDRAAAGDRLHRPTTLQMSGDMTRERFHNLLDELDDAALLAILSRVHAALPETEDMAADYLQQINKPRWESSCAAPHMTPRRPRPPAMRQRSKSHEDILVRGMLFCMQITLPARCCQRGRAGQRGIKQHAVGDKSRCVPPPRHCCVTHAARQARHCCQVPA